MEKSSFGEKGRHFTVSELSTQWGFREKGTISWNRKGKGQQRSKQKKGKPFELRPNDPSPAREGGGKDGGKSSQHDSDLCQNWWVMGQRRPAI